MYRGRGSRVGWWALAAIVGLCVVRDPVGAAHAGKALGHFAMQAWSALGTLASNL
jgi:hypothetical protein